MYATVYRTRAHGVRLPRPSGPVAGRLVLEKYRDGYMQPRLVAKLTVEMSNALVLPELHEARVLKITAHGIVVTGSELIPRRTTRKSSTDRFQQTWWCLIHTVGLADALDVLNEDDQAFGRIAHGTSS